jgi:hypothetical protein
MGGGMARLKQVKNIRESTGFCDISSFHSDLTSSIDNCAVPA